MDHIGISQWGLRDLHHNMFFCPFLFPVRLNYVLRITSAIFSSRMKNLPLHLIVMVLFLTVHKSLKAGNPGDSARVVRLFDNVLTGKGDSSAIHREWNSFRKKVETGDREFGQLYYYYLGKYFFQSGQIDSIPPVISKGLALVKGDRDYRWAVKFYNLEGSYYSLRRDYEKAIDCFRKSLRLCEEHHDDIQTAYINNNIANLFFSLLDYDNAYTYSLRAYTLMKKHPEDPNYASILAVYSVAESRKGDVKQAEQLAKKAREFGEAKGDVNAMIIAEYALGDIYANRGMPEAAADHFLASADLSEKYRQYHYSMLSRIGLLRVYLDAGRFEEAVSSGERALELSSLLNNENVQYSLKKNLARAYFGINDSRRAFNLLDEAHEIFIRSADVQTRKAVNDMLIRYETEKKEKQLARNKLLLTQKDLESSRARSWVLGLSALLLLLVAGGVFLRFRNRTRVRQMQLEHETETLYALIRGEEQERSRLSGELHDGIASSLTSIRYMVESLPDESGKDRLLRMLDATHHDTRRVAHNLAPLSVEKYGLAGALAQFATENSSDDLQLVFIAGGEVDKIPKALSLFLYRAAQELVQNAMKYASPSGITVQLLVGDDQIRCSVENDGTGFDPALISRTGGLSNLMDRVRRVGGTFDIDSSPEAAFTVVSIVIPRANSYL